MSSQPSPPPSTTSSQHRPVSRFLPEVSPLLQLFPSLPPTLAQTTEISARPFFITIIAIILAFFAREKKNTPCCEHGSGEEENQNPAAGAGWCGRARADHSKRAGHWGGTARKSERSSIIHAKKFFLKNQHLVSVTFILVRRCCRANVTRPLRDQLRNSFFFLFLSLFCVLTGRTEVFRELWVSGTLLSWL